MRSEEFHGGGIGVCLLVGAAIGGLVVRLLGAIDGTLIGMLIGAIAVSVCRNGKDPTYRPPHRPDQDVERWVIPPCTAWHDVRHYLYQLTSTMQKTSLRTHSNGRPGLHASDLAGLRVCA